MLYQYGYFCLGPAYEVTDVDIRPVNFLTSRVSGVILYGNFSIMKILMADISSFDLSQTQLLNYPCKSSLATKIYLFCLSIG